MIRSFLESESFTVTPDYINMHSLEHAIFEIMFVANEPEQFHSANLRAIIEWVDLRDSNDDDDLISINLPLLANIRVLGNQEIIMLVQTPISRFIEFHHVITFNLQF